jgi:YbbR domain-containing protein
MSLKLRSKKHSLKILSFLTAIVLWSYVLSASRSVIEKTVTVQYLLPDDTVFQVKPVQEINVTFEGPRAFIRSIVDKDEKLVIDLTKPPYVNNSKPQIILRATDIVVPFGIQAQKVSPRALSLKLEKKMSKILPVKIPNFPELPTDLEMTGLKVSPKEVEVTGPRSVIQRMKEVSTKSIDVENLYGQSSLVLDWNFPDERVVVTKGASPEIRYNLKARRSNLLLEKVPIRLMGDGELLRQQEVDLILWAPTDIVRRVDKRDINVQVWAEVPLDAKGKVEVELRAVLPPRLHLVEIRPKRVLVEPR